MTMEKDRLKGKAKEGVGKVREKAGEITDNEEMIERGQDEQVEGRAQETWGKVKEKAGDLKDKVT
jgi:uncharacterized protein YjbJ (UPF0337 family)